MTKTIEMTGQENCYTATTAFLEALSLAGITHCFVNLGSDHPSFMEAMATSKTDQGDRKMNPLPEFIAVTHEMVALSAAQGYYQATGKMAALILHVDCGLLNAGGAIHNVFRARVPVLVFAGLSAVTIEGEMRGSRTEFINWVQDVHDQPGIVRNYSKYSYEFRTGRNIGQVTMRATQIAMTEPKGPVYLFGAREVMEEILPLPRVPLNPLHWQPVSPQALPPSSVRELVGILLDAKNCLVITSWIGNSHEAADQILKLCERLELPVLDHSPFALNFPTTHRLYQGSQWSGCGQHPLLSEADVVLIVDSDIPFIPSQNKPNADAIVIHIDSDPLKSAMPLFYIPSQYRFAVNSAVALEQLNDALPETFTSKTLQCISDRSTGIKERHEERRDRLSKLSAPERSLSGPQPAAVAIAALGRALPEDSFVVSEAISNYGVTLDHLGFTDPSRFVTSGASSLGYGGGASVGAKIGIKSGFAKNGKETLVCCISGDGSYMFSVPSTVQHLSTKTGSPVLTIILSNGGWKSPKLSTLLVHPEGYASRAAADEINVGFGPSAIRPDYPSLAVAAGGGPRNAWGTSVISGAKNMVSVFQEAINVVQNGMSATVEVVIPEI